MQFIFINSGVQKAYYEYADELGKELISELLYCNNLELIPLPHNDILVIDQDMSTNKHSTGFSFYG